MPKSVQNYSIFTLLYIFILYYLFVFLPTIVSYLKIWYKTKILNAKTQNY